MLAIEMSNITYYNERLGCGIAMQFDKQVGSYLVNILYSGNFLHSSPVAVNLVSNVLLHRAGRGQYEIHVNNNPLMRFVSTLKHSLSHDSLIRNKRKFSEINCR